MFLSQKSFNVDEKGLHNCEEVFFLTNEEIALSVKIAQRMEEI